jgi:hypothetical protein
MKVHADFIPVTGSSVLTNITVQFDRKDLQFKQKEGLSTASVNILGSHHLHDPAAGQHVRGCGAGAGAQ